MKPIVLTSASRCAWDEVSLGEAMLRFDPGDMRIKTARTFRVWEGGGEYNVARALTRCFRLKTALVSANVDNEIGRLLEDCIRQGGVDQSHVVWMPFDGVGKRCRVGLNFTERGFGARKPLGVSDRGHAAAAALKKGDVDWDKIFITEGARWFHTGGIFAALSDTTRELALEAVEKANKANVIVSYDLNYRPSLWSDNGGMANAQKTNRAFARRVDVLIGNEEDFQKALGVDVPGTDDNFKTLAIDGYKTMMTRVAEEYPNLKAIAVTLRNAKTASIHDWSALLLYENAFYQSRTYETLEVFDRVGGGDSFVSGLIYGFLSGKTPEECVAYGVSHGALAMTTPGDASMASLEEVGALMHGASARIER